MSTRGEFGTIAFYDPQSGVEDVVEVSITKISVELGKSPRLILAGPFDAATTLALTPQTLRLLRALLDSIAVPPMPPLSPVNPQFLTP